MKYGLPITKTKESDMTQELARLNAPLHRHHRPGLLARLLGWDATFRQRTHLVGLTDAQLRDIGITRNEAAREGERPVWDAPQHWKR